MPYTIHDQQVDIAQEPHLKDGTLWVPLRALGEALGGNVDWDPDNRVAILYLGPYITTVKIGDVNVDTDGQQYQLQAAPYLEDGETWVPVRFFNYPLGYALDVNLEQKHVTLSNPNAA